MIEKEIKKQEELRKFKDTYFPERWDYNIEDDILRSIHSII